MRPPGGLVLWPEDVGEEVLAAAPDQQAIAPGPPPAGQPAGDDAAGDDPATATGAGRQFPPSSGSE